MGNYLTDRRKELGLTMKQVAKAVGVSEATISRWEGGQIANMKRDKIAAYAAALRVNPTFIMTGETSDDLASGPVLSPNVHSAPIVGSIPAGVPRLAVEERQGYGSIPYSDQENYFFLRVNGESMAGAGIHTGDLVLIRRQPCAEDGQIVACRVNGDEATLKRYKCQGDTIFLLPENPDFEPRIVSMQDFENGNAEIFGVAVELRRTL